MVKPLVVGIDQPHGVGGDGLRWIGLTEPARLVFQNSQQQARADRIFTADAFKHFGTGGGLLIHGFSVAAQVSAC
ncbi:hypothetical protein SDC9_128875 [bioreactor metagenome]|uniref:Uncharacterized protein n=1 Tax=bioreactor metagenome TaxID=1076179 RepID=A0A645CYA7_9ZZZZ